MPASEETTGPAAALERALVERAVRALADGDEALDAAALASDPPDGGALVAALRERTAEGAVIGCVGVLERLESFAGVVHTLVALAAERQATVVLALANDAAGSDGAAGGRRSVWSEGALAELRGLLPEDHVAFDVVALRGAALVPAGGSAELTAEVETGPGATAPAAFVLAFGPRAPRLAAAAAIAPADLSAERAHERTRTAELEVLRARVAALDARPQLAPANGAQAPESAA
jgi:hypothetical protein